MRKCVPLVPLSRLFWCGHLEWFTRPVSIGVCGTAKPRCLGGKSPLQKSTCKRLVDTMHNLGPAICETPPTIQWKKWCHALSALLLCSPSPLHLLHNCRGCCCLFQCRSCSSLLQRVNVHRFRWRAAAPGAGPRVAWRDVGAGTLSCGSTCCRQGTGAPVT